MDTTLRPLWAIGLKSDSALSGVDVALVQTDGVDIFQKGPVLFRPYLPEMKEKIESVLGEKGQLDTAYLDYVSQKVTDYHIEAVQTLLDKTDRSFRNVDIIGFPGHTVLHRPQQKLSIQIGDAQKMADYFRIPVVNRFYQADLLSGGKGSPIFPVFYEAMLRDIEKPAVILSIGGLTSLTYLGQNGEMQAFDVGAGNCLMDAWMYQKMGAEMDFDGLWAARGQVDERLLKKLLSFPYIQKIPPKSLDRDELLPLLSDVEGCSVADGVATLTAFTAQSIFQAVQNFLPQMPTQVIITGGGAYNPALVKNLKILFHGINVQLGNEIGLDSNGLDAQGFAFLAARSLFSLPFTFPQTTGVEQPLSGGRLFEACKK